MFEKLRLHDWDFLTLVAGWNLFGLPVLLGLLGFGLSLRRSRLAARAGAVTDADAQASADARPAREAGLLYVPARVMALIHLGLGLRGGIGLAQELLTLREQGIPQSFPLTGIVGPAVATLMNLAIGHGLWRLRRWSRVTAIAWNVLAGAIMGLAVAWQWRFGASVDLDHWPDYLVSVGLPWVLVSILLLPRTREDFLRPALFPGDHPSADGRPPRPYSWASILLLLLLTVVVSTLAIDVLDWLVRSLGPDLVGA